MEYGINILLNNACTKRCRYCYEKNLGNQVLSFENVDRIIEKFKEIPEWNRSIEFFGGEPSLSLPVIEMIMDKYPSVNYSMISNGFFLNEDDYEEYLKKVKNLKIAFSIEGTKNTHEFYRGGKDDYKKMFNNIIDLRNKNYDVSVNISINNKLIEDIEEFVKNTEALINNDIGIHFYNLKSEHAFNNIKEYVSFLEEVKKRNENIFKMLIGYKDDYKESDIEFLCTFDNKITISSDLKLIPCAWQQENRYLDLEDVTREKVLENFVKLISNNHKSKYKTCENCNVPVGDCQISCVPFIEGCLNAEKYELLELLCNIQKLNHELRKECKSKEI